MIPTPMLVVICGPSGVGKSTILGRVLPDFPNIVFSVSHTTRESREGEVHGKDYYFTTPAEFQAGIRSGGFLEWAEVYGNFYGTRSDRLAQTKITLLDIDPQGVRQVRDKAPTWGYEVTYIAVMPPRFDAAHQNFNDHILYDRLVARGTEDEATIDKRVSAMAAYAEIADEEGMFDHILINDDLDTAVAEMRDLLTAASVTKQWPPRTTIEATRDIPVADSDGKGNQTVIRKGARGTVGTGDGGARTHLDKVDFWYGSTIFATSFLWQYRESFRVVEQETP